MGDLAEPTEKPTVIKAALEKEKEILGQYNEGLLTEDERYQKTVGIWQEAKKEVDDMVPQSLNKFGPVYSMVSSAARGSWGQINQMTGMKGLVLNPAGRIIDFPIVSSYKEGLNVLEYFISTHGARKGTADTALKTAKAGYLTRRLVDVAQDVIITEDDCGEKKGLLIRTEDLKEYEEELAPKLKGRILSAAVKLPSGKSFKAGDLLTAEDAEQIENEGIDEIRIRSPLSCQTRFGICSKCYGSDLGNNKLIKQGEAVGIIAAQAIGEPGTQLTMRTFNTGGVAAKGGDITLGLPRVDELFEARTPGNPAVMSEVKGTVIEIKTTKEVGSAKETVIYVLPQLEDAKKAEKGKTEAIGYPVPFGKRLTVKEGDEVEPGDALTDGPLDVKTLFKLAGRDKAQNYILREVGRVYNIQGVPINVKHLEIIIKQMFSRFKIKDPGDTNFNIGKVVESSSLGDENERVKNMGGKEATVSQLLMGISKVSLSTSSFLSAASFQDTARVLIRTATEGGRDSLRGLKENVIIGHLIPAGTGYRQDLETLKRYESAAPAPKEEEKETV